MTFTNVNISGLESYQPAVDYRSSGRIGILDGRNFAWDASGVYSAYASRLVSGTDSLGLSPSMVQSIDLVDDIHVVVNGDVWKLNPSSAGSPIGTWEAVDTLATLVEADPADVEYNFRRWTSAYLGGSPYGCSWNYGVFRVDLTVGPPTYTRLTSVGVPGFPTDDTPVIAIAETNGRMLYLTEDAVYWSGANAPEDLTPALGGAGFQVIAEVIGGKPFTVTRTSIGAIIWTTGGALVCEFIGGDSVFRFYQLATQALPISAFAVTRLPDDTYIILTRLGLFKFASNGIPEAITPLFNEFLREYLRQRPNEFGHVWYSITDGRLYIAMRTGLAAFVDTYTLDIMLDRWGRFSEQHIGLFDYGTSRGQLAYANPYGVASFLLSPTDPRKNRESTTSPGTYIGLSANVTIGWIRAENLVPHADVVQELQEIQINRLIPYGTLTVTYVDEEFIVSATPTVVDEGSITDAVFTTEDEGSIADQEQPTDYGLEIITDIITDDELGDDSEYIYVPELVRQNRRSDTWVTIAPALYHRLKFSANDADEFFRVNSMNLTVAYGGNLS